MTKDDSKIRIVFMGTSTFADVILNSLLEEKYNIVGVYTQPDKKTGRKQELGKSVVKITAEKNNLQILQPEKFDESATEELNKLKPDLIIVAAYGKILPGRILEIPKLGCMNVHASLLPKYRGPSPVQNALLNGENETGSTIMLMDKGIDAGDILSQEKISIHPDETCPELMGRLAGISSSLLLDTIPRWMEKKITPEKQDNSKETFCQLIEKNDGKILWNEDAQTIYNKYRAFYSWPGTFAFWKNRGTNTRINFRKISYLKENPEEELHLGEVFETGDRIAVQTALGVIILHEIQIEGKNVININDFINGYSGFIGTVLI